MVIDFNNSFISWRTNENSFGKFNAESGLFFKNIRWILGAKVTACNMYVDKPLIKTPGYYFQPLFSESECKIFRTYITNKATDDEQFKASEKFKSHDVNIVELPRYEKSELSDKSNNKTYQGIITASEYELQFPVKHYNVKDSSFQVETGPVAFPADDQLCTAYIVFNSLNRFEALVFKNENGWRTKGVYKEKNCEIKIVSKL